MKLTALQETDTDLYLYVIHFKF